MESQLVTPAEVLTALERVLTSAAFRDATRPSKLLRFVVEETLAGRGDRLKDYTLGSEGLGRGAQFDPRTDPIARVEAARLRDRLALYYADEGTADALVISVPKGGYVPHFEARPPTPATPSIGPAAARHRGWMLWALAAGTALATGLAVWTLLPDAHVTGEVRLEVLTPPTTDPVSLAISPDGRLLVFVATSAGTSRLWLRPLDTTEARPLAGTEYASAPFWAPDSRSIGFFADSRVKSLNIDTGVVDVVSKVPVPAGAAWNRDGVIVHPLVPDGPLFRTAIGGATPVPATALLPGQSGHRGPQFLPDGRHFLFYATGPLEVRGIYLGELGTTTVRRLTDADTPAVFLPPDHLLYVRESTLLGQRFDQRRMVVNGPAWAVAEGIASSTGFGGSALAASAAGPIAYRTGPSGGKRQFVWFDRKGIELSRIGAPESRGPSYLSISPDARRLIVQKTSSGNTDLWLMDLERDTSVRFTSEPGADIAPIWSPLGDRVIYSTQRAGVFDLYQRAIAGSVSEEVLRSNQSKSATDWSHDGRLLLFRTISLGMDADIWAMPLAGDRKAFAVVQTPFEERDAQFSPDGLWIAYQSNESGRFEIYVQPYRRPGERVRISTNGGVQTRWRSDGRELFYLTLDSQLVAVPVTFAPDGHSVDVGAVTSLFHARVGALQDVSLTHFVVAPDGQRFLLDTVVDEVVSPITIILNWNSQRRQPPR